MISSTEPQIPAPQLCRTFHPICLLCSLDHWLSSSLLTGCYHSWSIPLISLRSSFNLLPVPNPFSCLCLGFLVFSPLSLSSLDMVAILVSWTRCRWLCVCLYMYVSSWVYVLGPIQARVNLECHSLLSLVFYETVTILKLTDQARLTGSSPRTCLPCLPSSGITCMYWGAWPFFWFWR